MTGEFVFLFRLGFYEMLQPYCGAALTLFSHTLLKQCLLSTRPGHWKVEEEEWGQEEANEGDDNLSLLTCQSEKVGGGNRERDV